MNIKINEIFKRGTLVSDKLKSNLGIFTIALKLL